MSLTKEQFETEISKFGEEIHPWQFDLKIENKMVKDKQDLPTDDVTGTVFFKLIDGFAKIDYIQPADSGPVMLTESLTTDLEEEEIKCCEEMSWTF